MHSNAKFTMLGVFKLSSLDGQYFLSYLIQNNSLYVVLNYILQFCVPCDCIFTSASVRTIDLNCHM